MDNSRLIPGTHSSRPHFPWGSRWGGKDTPEIISFDPVEFRGGLKGEK